MDKNSKSSSKAKSSQNKVEFAEDMNMDMNKKSSSKASSSSSKSN